MSEQRWELCSIVQTHEVLLVYNFTPVGSRVREYENNGARAYKNLITTLLAEGWEPIGHNTFKRPYQGYKPT